MKIVEINKLFSQEWKSNGIIWNDTFFKKIYLIEMVCIEKEIILNELFFKIFLFLFWKNFLKKLFSCKPQS